MIPEYDFEIITTVKTINIVANSVEFDCEFLKVIKFDEVIGTFNLDKIVGVIRH